VTPLTAAALIAALVLAALHLLAGRLRFLGGTPRSIYLSLAGGVSVAYVFVHLLPELAEGQETVSRAAEGALDFAERHVYLLALAGLASFYGLERAAVVSRRRSRTAGETDATGPGVFWLHVGSFALYNALIGYLLLHRAGEESVQSLLVFTAAMGLHFVVNDYGLREHHKQMYDHVGRWILAAAILFGYALGLAVAIRPAALALLFALLAGGVVLNVLKEELPEERESRFWAFALGAGAYAALLLVA
jgi:hypothetical protein